MLVKRLGAASFQLPPITDEVAQVQIDGTAFAALLAGIDFTAARRGWYRRAGDKSIKGIDSPAVM
jgi:transposase